MIGLSIGWRLAQAGCPVEVFDSGRAARGATWAAAGMLAAGLEVEPGEERLYGLNRASQALWPDFSAELEAASGITVGLRQEGTLWAALTRDDVGQLRFQHDLQTSFGVRVEWLTGAEARHREPYLHPNVPAALFSPDDHQVDNRRVGEALALALRATGGQVREECPVEIIDIANGRAQGVRVGGRIIQADYVVLAAGAWSRSIGGLLDAIRPPVRPIKGQMLALAMDPDTPLLRHVLWADGVYLVPRRDGRLIVGGTTEERGFDPRLTAGAMLSLLHGAWRAVPGTEELEIIESWAGFRPGSRDDAPILGPCEIDRLIIATGHHRNGILLTPITAQTISRLILTGETDPAIADFSIRRFEATPC